MQQESQATGAWPSARQQAQPAIQELGCTVSVLTIRHQVKHRMTDNAEDLTATGQMRDKLFQESTETATYGSWGCRSTYGKAPIAPTRGLSSKVQTPGAKARG